MEYETLAYGDLCNDAKRLLTMLPRRDVCCVFGVPRKGMIPATIIAEILKVPCYSLDVLTHLEDRALPGERETSQRWSKYAYMYYQTGKPVLVIDEGCHTGESLAKATRAIEQATDLRSFVQASVYATELYAGVAVFAERINSETTLCEWDAFQHPVTRKWMFDLDGVLCDDRDALKIVDQSPEYFAWIHDVPALHVPDFGVHSICTWREDSTSRVITQEWLLRKGLSLPWTSLYMPQGREVWGNDPAKFKAAKYKDSEATLFVESDREQAILIASYSRKPVLCVNPWECFNNG